MRPISPPTSSRHTSRSHVELSPSTKRVLGWLIWFDFACILFIYFGASMLHEVSQGISEIEFLKEDILNYNYRNSIIDLVVLSVIRPVTIEIAYIHNFNKNVFGAAFSTGVTTAYVVIKCILGSPLLIFQWYAALLVIFSFVFAWSECFLILRKKDEARDERPLLGRSPTEAQHPNYSVNTHRPTAAYSPTAYWSTVSSMMGDFDLEGGWEPVDDKPADGDVPKLPNGKPVPGYGGVPVDYSVLGAATIKQVCALISDEWEDSGEAKGIKTMRHLRKESGLYMVKGTGVINRPAWSVANMIQDFSNRPKFDGLFERSEVVHVHNKFISVIHIMFKPIWPVAPRDNVHLQALRQEPDGTCIIASISVHGGVPPLKGYIRAIMGASGYVITPIDSESCTVALLIDSDGGSSLPKMVYNLAVRSQTMAIASMRVEMEKTEDVYLGPFTRGQITPEELK